MGSSIPWPVLPAGGRGQLRGRGDQGGRPGPPDADLGAQPSPAAAARRAALREYFPAALGAFDDLAAADTLELLAKAPDLASAARLATSQITAALKRVRRRGIPAKAAAIAAALRKEHMRQPQPLAEAYAATVSSLTVIIAALNGEIGRMERQVTVCFRGYPDATIYLSQPGIGEILGARGAGRVR